MTETISPFQDDEPRVESRLFRAALADLQQIVTRFMLKDGRSIDSLTGDEQQEFVDRITPHLKFEVESSEAIYKGMPIVIEGPGAFLVSDDAGEIIGAQVTLDGDVITGVIDDVQAFIVPAREVVLNTSQDSPIPIFENSISAVVIINGATFNCSPLSDGTFEVSHDLSMYDVIIPVVYDMDTRVADIAA